MKTFDTKNGPLAVSKCCNLDVAKDVRECVQTLGSQWVAQGTKVGNNIEAYPPEHPVTYLFRVRRVIWCMVLTVAAALFVFGFMGGDRFAGATALCMLIVSGAVAQIVCGADTFRPFCEALLSLRWAYRIVQEGREMRLSGLLNNYSFHQLRELSDEALSKFTYRIVSAQAAAESGFGPNDSGELKEKEFNPNFAALERLGLTKKTYKQYLDEAKLRVGAGQQQLAPSPMAT
jgi:hypothetical protein